MADDDDDDEPIEELPTYREIVVPPTAAGLRLDRFLALRFRHRSRTEFARGIREGRVTTPEGVTFRASSVVRGGEVLQLHLDALTPSSPAPPFPPILHEDDRVVAVAKPPGMMVHPAGTRWVWALIGLAKKRWPEHRIDLVHRLDKDTSGVLLLTKDADANRALKLDFKRDHPTKEYLAVAKGVPVWDSLVIDAPIGRENAEIRIRMAVRDDGQPSRTDVEVVARRPEAGLSLLRCRLRTGRTHQIRVHLAHVGLPLLGDLLYGVPASVFLHVRDHGIDDEILAITGAPRHALHAARLAFRHPDGHDLVVEAPLPADMATWWSEPEALPWRRPT